jgi:hypothetical protein
MTEVIYGLIVFHECTVKLLQGGMSGHDRVVGLTYSCGNLGGVGINGEFQLILLSIINREKLYQHGCEPRAPSPTKAVQNQETLKICALARQLMNSVQVKSMTSWPWHSAHGIVTDSIFLACNELLLVEEQAVSMARGFRSTNTVLFTCLSSPISLKKVLNKSSSPLMILSLGV